MACPSVVLTLPKLFALGLHIIAYPALSLDRASTPLLLRMFWYRPLEPARTLLGLVYAISARTPNSCPPQLLPPSILSAETYSVLVDCHARNYPQQGDHCPRSGDFG